jgi:hypothetical protein
MSNHRCVFVSEHFSLALSLKQVGLMTGDVSIRPNATVVVMTTEITRTMLYSGAETMREVVGGRSLSARVRGVFLASLFLVFLKVLLFFPAVAPFYHSTYPTYFTSAKLPLYLSYYLFRSTPFPSSACRFRGWCLTKCTIWAMQSAVLSFARYSVVCCFLF